MTVSSTSNKVTFNGNGATTTWPFTFSCEDETDIEVYVTDADGVITQISTSDYTVTLNAATAPNPTPVGGSVEYPLLGAPLAADEMITLLRTMPLTQPTSLANQGVLYQPTIEQQFDSLLMQTQQLNELIGRQITVAVSDDDPEPLPPAAQRANLLMGFDADGNPIAVEFTDAGQVMVSSAMIPVVEAATLALARTALGLGDIAVEDIGAGLEDDGSGKVRVINTPAAVAAGQVVTASFHLKEYHVTGAQTFTNPAASTLFDGFGYYVYALTGAVTFAIDAGDAFSGGTNGQSLIIPAGSRAWISTDGTLTWFIRVEQLNDSFSPANFQINATVAGNNLTVAIKDRNGNDPSTASPVYIPFRDATIGNGNIVLLALTSALSIVAANGATLGTTNNNAFRFWLVVFNDAGTLRLGLINCLDSSLNIYPLGRIPIASSTQISAAATSAHTFYTQGAAVTTRAYAILGHMSWETGLATAGTYASAPTRIEQFKPQTPLPGTVIQTQGNTTGAASTTTTVMTNDDSIPPITEGAEFMTQAITPVSAANVLKISVNAFGAVNTGNACVGGIFQDATVNALTAIEEATVNAFASVMSMVHRMLANTTAATTFRFRAGPGSAATYTFNGAASARLLGGVANSFMSVDEIMS